MTLGQKQEQFSRYLADLLNHVHALGMDVRIGEVWRPQEMQDIYLKTGRSKAKYSFHQDKLAVDLFITKDGVKISDPEMGKIGAWWESLDKLNSWGGYFTTIKDAPHFSYGGERKRI